MDSAGNFTCTRAGCDLTASGCGHSDCSRYKWRANPHEMNPRLVSVAPPTGCICPPTSEQTCENPYCPRQDPMKRLKRAQALVTAAEVERNG